MVMQFIREPYHTLSKVEFEVRDGFRDSIWRSLTFLHKNGFVHGDLRPSNVFVSEVSAKALIMDFDEAGLAGSVSYPPNLNTKDITWPDDVTDGEPITKAHDEFMFNRLFTSKAAD